MKNTAVFLMVVICLVLCSLCGCQTGESGDTQVPTSVSNTPSTARPALTIEDFEKIEVGMTVAEVAEILGCKGKYTGAWFDFYEYEGIDGTKLVLECEKIDEAIPKYDDNLIIIRILIQQLEP